jgi:hypothetical protein
MLNNLKRKQNITHSTSAQNIIININSRYSFVQLSTTQQKKKPLDKIIFIFILHSMLYNLLGSIISLDLLIIGVVIVTIFLFSSAK